MANFLAPIINDQQENSNGAPLSGGTIEVYLAGTSTPATTYSDKAGSTPNTWPIVLNTLGLNNQGAVWLVGGATYKFIVKDSTGVVQRTVDNVSGINDSAITTDQWLVFQGTPTYVSATSFTVSGDQTQVFQIGRRVKTTNTGGTVYSIVTNSAYSAPNTTVTVINDSGALDSGLSSVAYSVISVLQTSLPGGLPVYGQCRLFKSGSNLMLSPYLGNKITINGQICTIPSGGVTLAPTSLTPGTLYYIYAYVGATGIAIEASTTGHSSDGATGIEIKTGDPTRALVGMARPIAGPAWSDIAAQRLVIGWFNRLPIQCRSVNGSGPSVSSSTPTPIVPVMEFLSWGAPLTLGFTSVVSNSLSSALSRAGFSLNSSTTYLTGGGNAIYQTFAANSNGSLSASTTLQVAEGYNFTYVLGSADTGTATWAAGLEQSGLTTG